MSSEYRVNILISAKDQSAQSTKQAATGFQKLQQAVSLAAVAFAALKAARVATELVKLGAAAQATEHRLIRFAGGAQEAENYLTALNAGADNTIDRLTGMAQASRMLETDMVRNTSEMEIAGAMVSKLGYQTWSTERRMQSLTMLLANQSIRRLDDFGMSVERVRKRQKELEAQGYSTEQAFRAAVFDEARVSLAVLGDTSALAATKIGMIEAGLKDTKVAVGGLTLKIAENLGILDALSYGIRELADTTQTITEEGFKAAAAQDSQSRASKNLSGDYDRLGRSTQEVWLATTGATRAAGLNARAQAILAAELDNAERQFGATDKATLEYLESLNETTEASHDFQAGARGIIEVLQKERQAMMDTAAKTLDLGMSYADYQQDVTKSAADFTERRARIETEHQAKLEELTEKGAAKRVQVDADAEEEKLQDLKDKLLLAEMRYGEFGEKTAASTRLAKEMQIADLREQIVAQEGMLEKHYSGQLVAKGQNVNKLLAEEERHYQEALAELDKAEAAQEQSQKQSLGRMVLAHFDAWTEMNLATDGFTSEESAFVMAMRMDIAEEYGLITDAAIKELNEQESEWRGMWDMAKGGAIDTYTALGKVIARLNEMPSEKRIKIIYELGERPADIPKQHGGPVLGERAYWVGEAGPELFIPHSSGHVYNAQQSRQIVQQQAAPIPGTSLGRLMPSAPGGGGMGSASMRAGDSYPITVIVQGDVLDDRSADRIADAIARRQRLRGIRRH